jgi:hypothetical protein
MLRAHLNLAVAAFAPDALALRELATVRESWPAAGEPAETESAGRKDRVADHAHSA